MIVKREAMPIPVAGSHLTCLAVDKGNLAYPYEYAHKDEQSVWKQV